jgi:hypothetical protein
MSPRPSCRTGFRAIALTWVNDGSSIILTCFCTVFSLQHRIGRGGRAAEEPAPRLRGNAGRPLFLPAYAEEEAGGLTSINAGRAGRR